MKLENGGKGVHSEVPRNIHYFVLIALIFFESHLGGEQAPKQYVVKYGVSRLRACLHNLLCLSCFSFLMCQLLSFLELVC